MISVKSKRIRMCDEPYENPIPDGKLPEQRKDFKSAELPDPFLVNYYKLVEDRKLWLDEEIADNVLDIENYILLWNKEDEEKGIAVEDRKPIYIYIMSPGGYLCYTMSLVDVILLSKTPVYTINMGECASGAALIFMAGHKRYMTERATVLIHEGSTSLNGDSTKVFDASKSYENAIRKMHKYITERTKITARKLNMKRSNDWELDSKDCLECGVCDVVVSSMAEIL